MTARARTALLAIAVAAVSITLSGCASSLCSRDQYLNTVLGKEPKHVGLQAAPPAAVVADDNAAKPAA